MRALLPAMTVCLLLLGVGSAASIAAAQSEPAAPAAPAHQ
jgi:hypothetical protein